MVGERLELVKMVLMNVDVNGNSLPCTISLDGFEVKEFKYLRIRSYSDFDSLGVIVGEEGSGKSCYTLQRALYMDANFCIDNIVFNDKQFLKATETLPKGSSIVWDESDSASEHWASKVVKTLTRRLKRCRKNNYTIFLVTPTFFDFNKYFIFHRALFLIDVYAVYDEKKEVIKRGRFRSFNRRSMKDLYIKGKIWWNMKAEYPNFIGSFTNYPKNFPIDVSDGGAYDRKKDAAMIETEEETISPRVAVINYRRKIIPLLTNVLEGKAVGLSQRELSKALDSSPATINGDLKIIRKENKV